MFAIKRPHYTEKALALNGKGKYAFIVAYAATKREIKKQIHALYKVQVVRVNTQVYKKRKVRRYRKQGVVASRVPAYKKAVVTLRKGDLIDVHADVA